MPHVMILLTFLLLLGAGAEEILRGREIKPHSHPYMAFIEFVDMDGNKSHCGGFLVLDNFILTAAHCLGSSMKLTLGAHNVTGQEETQQIIPVAKAIPHPDYSGPTSTNDIMLLKLQTKARRTKAVRPLRLLMPKVHVKPGDLCSITGWGKMAPEGEFPKAPQEVELTVQKDQECEARYPGYYNKAKEICVGDPKNKRAAFQVDYGGPLVCNQIITGIVAFGGTDGSMPAVFTRVSSFLAWINKQVKNS